MQQCLVFGSRPLLRVSVNRESMHHKTSSEQRSQVYRTLFNVHTTVIAISECIHLYTNA